MTFIISLLRLILSFRYKCIDPDENSIDIWAKWSLAGAWLAGLFWGSASYFMFVYDSLSHQVFLAYVIVGATAGAVTTLSAQRSDIIGFILLATLPLSYRFLQSSHVLNMAMCILTILFAIFTFVIVRRFSNNLKEMLVECQWCIKTQIREYSYNLVLQMRASGISLKQILETITNEIKRESDRMLCCPWISSRFYKKLKVN